MRVGLFSLLMLVVGCAGAPPERTEYLLRFDSPAPEQLVPHEPRVGLRGVTVADYLRQPGLVVETGPNEVRPAQAHLWAEPLQDGLRIFLRAAITSILGEEVGMTTRRAQDWEQSVYVFVERFHGSMSGDAILVASFQITPAAGAPTREFRFSGSTPLESKGYAALVDAERRLAEELATAIASALASLR